MCAVVTRISEPENRARSARAGYGAKVAGDTAYRKPTDSASRTPSP
ncbi:MAG: hypothetical protein ACI82G_002049, partial [Bradymonadia bacterium]